MTVRIFSGNHPTFGPGTYMSPPGVDVLTARPEELYRPDWASPNKRAYRAYSYCALMDYRAGLSLELVKFSVRKALGYANRLKCPRRKLACLRVLNMIRKREASLKVTS